MTKNFKKFNIFVFISGFARSLIEIFIPLYLYKKGMTFNNILIYYLFINIFSVISSVILLKLGKKTKYRNFLILSSIFFITTYYLLNNYQNTLFFIITLALCYSVYRRSYWMAKRYYSIKYQEKRKTGEASAWITISGELAGLLSSLVGGIFLDSQKFITLATLSLILMLISIIPLFKIKEKKEPPIKKEEKNKIIKQIPPQNYIILFLYESTFYISLLFPLYLYIYVDNTYTFVGIINLLIGLSSIFFVWKFGKKMDKNKKDYLRLATIILCTLYFAKLCTTNVTIIAVIALLEGYLSKIHTTSYSRDIWFLGKNFNPEAYNFILETITNIGRLIIIIMFLLLGFNIKQVLFISIVIFFISSFFKFDDGKGGYI